MDMLSQNKKRRYKVTLYLPSLTTEELLRHASQSATTDLEKELAGRLELLCRDLDRDEVVSKFSSHY